MENGIQKFTGPTSAGQVTIPLADLDKQRAEHMAAIRRAEELESRKKEIFVTVSEAGGEEITNWKNLEDVTAALEKKLEKKWVAIVTGAEDKVLKIEEQLEEQKKQHKSYTKGLQEDIIQLVDEKSVLKDELTDLQTRHDRSLFISKQRLNIITKWKDSARDLFDDIRQLREDKQELLDELVEERNKKGIWKWL